jgi:hypothetical protein
MAQKISIENKLYGGYIDYTPNLIPHDQFYNHENNKPATFQFQLQDIGNPDFIVPSRGAYVTFEDNRFESRDEGVPDGVLFTGYIVDDPEPIFLGVNNGNDVFAYKVSCTSEEYLPQIKSLPSKIYVNKTRGFIIRDIVTEMFRNADIMPLDVSGVRDGGVERLYQVDPNKKFADMCAEFAKADAFRYRCLDGKLFYEPEAELLPGSSDPLVKLYIDREDPRFTPSNLLLERVATSIVNDVTVYGEDEPTTLVNERFVSDGYQGAFRLIHKPFGVTETVLVDDSFTSPNFDTSLWDEEDDDLAGTGQGDGSYLQMFEGAFNIVGGAGTETAPEVWLRSRRGIELSGIIEFRDGEFYFPPGATGSGLIGGLFDDENMLLANCLSGWMMNASAETLVSVIEGALTTTSYAMDNNPNYHYILRRRFEFDIPVGLPTVRRGPRGSTVVFGENAAERINGCLVTHSVERIDITDPQNVITAKSDILTTRIEAIPEFVLFAPVVSYSLHAVMNYCKIYRPQQIKVKVNGETIKIGDFLDGGLAAVQVDTDGRASLAWYAIPTSIPDPGITITPPSGEPFIFYKLGDPGEFINDSGDSAAFPMQADSGVGVAPSLQPNSDDAAREFFGAGSITGPRSGGAFLSPFPNPFSITGWFKTTTSDGPIYEFNSQAFSYVGVYITNGRLSSRLQAPENELQSVAVVNDGVKHHFAIVFTGGTTKIYIDGVLDTQGPQSHNPIAAATWSIGYGNPRWDSLGSIHIPAYFTGIIDEIGVWNEALSVAQVDGLYRVSHTSTGNGGGGGSGTPPPIYNPQTGVTIPPQGSIVDISYYRSEPARSRIKSTESIRSERGRFGDDGIRQHIILKDDIFPSPRTTDECQFLAQAFLADRATLRYEGSYAFETGERDITRLDIMPAPGDMIPCYIELGNGEKIDTDLHCTSVSTQFIGESAYLISLSVGPRNRFDDAQRKLLLSRRSSIENPEIRESEILIAEVLNTTGYSIPADPQYAVIANVTSFTFTVSMNQDPTINNDLPEGVVGYEIRRDDSGWGQGNYVARVSSSSFTLDRGARDKHYFIRPFNLSNQYSNHSALVRVIWPLNNSIPVGTLDGDLSAEGIRLYIPIDRNPDIGGWLVQKDDTDGPILYHGNGIDHRTLVIGAMVLIESGKVTITFPYSTGAFTVFVKVYNILGELGPGTSFTITRAAQVV